MKKNMEQLNFLSGLCDRTVKSDTSCGQESAKVVSLDRARFERSRDFLIRELGRSGLLPNKKK